MSRVKKGEPRRHLARLSNVLGLAGALLLQGCYYAQAVRGHMDLMQRSRSVSEVLDDPAVSGNLKERLKLVQEARQFSVGNLGLPDNKSYRSYANLDREFVVWNVIAAPEFSLQARQWCFPVAGCVAYRGYFDETAALKEAGKLSEDGYDISVGGVAAYSTLGRFSDPVLNTMMRWSDTDLIATLFHELAHQKIYVKNDTQFNESFATAVAEIGVERWFAARRDAKQLDTYLERKALRREMLQLVEDAKIKLAALYDSGIDEGEMRQRKEAILLQLSGDVSNLLGTRGSTTPLWLGSTLNNARLVSLGLYEGWLPAFRELYKNCNGKLPCFYERAQHLAALPQDARVAGLIRLTAEAENEA